MEKGAPQHPLNEEIARLSRPLAGRRVLAWVAFWGVLLVSLIPQLLPESPVKGADVLWNPGPLSSAHQPLAQDCRACHSALFSAVKDSDCQSCHEAVADHGGGGSGPMRCAECHREHTGAFGLAEQNRRFTAGQCAACHQAISRVSAGAKSGNVTDFGSLHPPFRVQVAGPDGALKRVRQDSHPSEPTALKFPHDIHLGAKGIAGPRGRQVLECADCHQFEPATGRFAPVTMASHCQSCHTLGFEPALPGRQALHGAPEKVLENVLEFYSFVAVHGVPLDARQPQAPLAVVRPGAVAPSASFLHGPGDVRSRAQAAAGQLFEKTGCVVCHAVSRTSETGAGWAIAPVAAPHRWMPQARFSHAAHSAQECQDCHRAAQSNKAQDILMPTIEDCRSCHAGQRAEPGKVSSDCGVCHGFHTAAEAAR